MYDEFERSVAGRRRSRFSTGTWILFGLVGFVFAGIAASVAGYFAVRRQVVRVVERIEARPAPQALRSLKALEALRTAEPRVAEALAAAEMFRNLDPDLLVAQEAEGGSLRVRTRGGEVRVGSGDYAAAVPDWVPAASGQPEETRQVFSLSSSKGSMGAVAWTTPDLPEQVMEDYRARLASEGFEVRAEGIHQEGSGASRDSQGTLWGESGSGDRHVFLVAARDGKGGTSVLLGYADRR
jgi:hypothetical protein